jgi:hypothetical protein
VALQTTKTAEERQLEEQLAELQERLSQEVAAFADPSREARKQRFEEACASTESFGRAFLPHYFESESAAFHQDLDAMTRAQRRHVFIVHGPREHAKSTRCRAGLLRRVLRGDLHYPLVVSEELKLAKGHLLTLQAELTSNPRVEEDFDVDVTRQNMSQGILRLRVTPRATGQSHQVRIDAVSYGSKVKGKIYLQHRPDFALLDDFEDGISSRNERIGREKVEWVLQDLYPAVIDTAPIVWIGNTARDTSALFLGMLEAVESEDALRAYLKRGTRPGGNVPRTGARRHNGPGNTPETPYASAAPPGEGEDATQAEISAYCYRATRIDERTGETVYLWPERYRAAWYQRMRATMGPAKFESEMNGSPIAEGVFFKREWFPTYDALPEGEELTYFLWGDPAFGTSRSASYKAIVVCASGGRRFWVVDAWLRQTEPVRAMIDALYVLFERWGPQSGGPGQLRHGKYENDFAQDDRLRRDFADAEERHGRSLPMSGDANNAPKDARIESLEGLASNGRIRWPSAEVAFTHHAGDVERLRRQLLSWPDGYDDGPDALESCVSRLRRIAGGGNFTYRSLGKRRYRPGGRRRKRRHRGRPGRRR